MGFMSRRFGGMSFRIEATEIIWSCSGLCRAAFVVTLHLFLSLSLLTEDVLVSGTDFFASVLCRKNNVVSSIAAASTGIHVLRVFIYSPPVVNRPVVQSKANAFRRRTNKPGEQMFLHLLLGLVLPDLTRLAPIQS